MSREIESYSLIIIDGREEVMAHGARTMPVRGVHYLSTEGGRPIDEERVLGRILSLVSYLESLQDQERQGRRQNGIG